MQPFLEGLTRFVKMLGGFLRRVVDDAAFGVRLGAGKPVWPLPEGHGGSIGSAGALAPSSARRPWKALANRVARGLQ
jgi:hypothetical protein